MERDRTSLQDHCRLRRHRRHHRRTGTADHLGHSGAAQAAQHRGMTFPASFRSGGSARQLSSRWKWWNPARRRSALCLRTMGGACRSRSCVSPAVFPGRAASRQRRSRGAQLRPRCGRRASRGRRCPRGPLPGDRVMERRSVPCRRGRLRQQGLPQRSRDGTARSIPQGVRRQFQRRVAGRSRRRRLSLGGAPSRAWRPSWGAA